MKIISFPAYSRTEKDDMGRAPAVARAWSIAMSVAANTPAGPGAERSAIVLAIYNALKGLAEVRGDERYLKEAGGTLTLENSEVKVFTESIDKFREQVNGAQADALVLLDQLIAAATEQPKDGLALV